MTAGYLLRGFILSANRACAMTAGVAALIEADRRIGMNDEPIRRWVAGPTTCG